MFRILSLSKGKGTCGKCGGTIERGRSCWARKVVYRPGVAGWTYRCFGCIPRLTPVEQVA